MGLLIKERKPLETHFVAVVERHATLLRQIIQMIYQELFISKQLVTINARSSLVDSLVVAVAGRFLLVLYQMMINL